VVAITFGKAHGVLDTRHRRNVVNDACCFEAAMIEHRAPAKKV